MSDNGKPSAAGANDPRPIKRSARTSNAVAATLCLILVGLSLYLAGIFDSKINKTIRESPVYAEPGSRIDADAAERIVGNRQLILIYLATDLGDRGSDICEDAEKVANGNLVVIIGDDLDTYGCALIPDRDGDKSGNAFVAESAIDDGLTYLDDDINETPKTMVATFDRLVVRGLLPKESRSITPAFSRLALAGITLGGLAVCGLALYVNGRRVGTIVAGRESERRRIAGRTAERDVLLASIASQILEADPKRDKVASRLKHGKSSSDLLFMKRYDSVIEGYRELNEECAAEDPTDEQLGEQVRRAEDLRDVALKMNTQ